MRYDEDANHKLFWAIAVGLVIATLMIITSGCQHIQKKVIMINCEQTNTTVPEGRLDLCEKY